MGKSLLWSSRYQAFLAAPGLIGAIETTSEPIRFAGGSWEMAECGREIYRYGPERVEKYERPGIDSWQPCKGSLLRRGCKRRVL